MLNCATSWPTNCRRSLRCLCFLFGILTRTDDHTMDKLPDTEIMKRWWAHMADIMATDADNVPVQIPLKRVFYLP